MTVPRKSEPRVCVIVLNFNGLEDTLACLASVLASTYPSFEVEVLDNGSTHNEAEIIRQAVTHPRLNVDRSEQNLGFAGGSNAVIRRTRSDYVVLLNNDTIVEPDWLHHLMAVAESDEQIAAVQPKVRSMSNPGYFEYAGAAGGMLDKLGMPYCRGRVVFDAEEDRGQYDQQAELFWGSGVCLLLDRRAVVSGGLLEEDFFFYHEETDLCWRLKNHGYRIVLAPHAVIHHKGSGSSLARLDRKIFYVHRNALMMVTRNCTWTRLLWLLPVRALLEVASIGFYILTRRPRLAIAVARADWSFVSRLPRLLRQRNSIGGDRKIAQGEMKPISVLWEYFVRRRRTYAEIEARRRSRTPAKLSRDSFLLGATPRARSADEAGVTERS